MYAALWRVLPGPAFVRVLLLLVLLAAVVLLCFEWLFPLVASWLPYDETTVDTTGVGAALPARAALLDLAGLPDLLDLPALRTLEDLA